MQDFFFFFMWRRWQLPCIALSLNNGMLICITRDVITSTVKRKHNNSSSAPPWDRLGWPTLALWRDAPELWISQTHTGTHKFTHTHKYVDTQSHKLFAVPLSSSHILSSSSAACLHCSDTHTQLFAHMLRLNCILPLYSCTHCHADSPVQLIL